MIKENYCDKCGWVWLIFDDKDNKKCEICGNILKPVPNEYYEEFQGKPFFSKEMKQKLIEDLVKTSTNFDQYYFDNAINIKGQKDEAFNAKITHGKAILQEANRVPKCPTCQSTAVEKISLTSKVVGGALFGLFSSNVRKTMHCKNCGYKW